MQTLKTTGEGIAIKTMNPTIKSFLSTRLRDAFFAAPGTKRLLAVMAAVSLVACGTATANDLYNPDLDTLGAAGANGQINPGPDGWVIAATKTLSGTFGDGADSETFCNVQQPGGDGVFFKPFQGQTNSNPVLDDLITVLLYQDNPSSPGTKCTLSGYASCEANFCALLPPPPSQSAPTVSFIVEFLDSNGNGIVTNSFDLLANGMHTDGAGDMGLLTTPQYTAPAGTVTVRVGTRMTGAYSTSGAQSFFVDAFDLESVPPPGSPVITNQPSSLTVNLGGTANFAVGVSNTVGASYYWLFNSAPLSDSAGHISGSATKTLTITGTAPGDIGHYQVLVSNSFGLSRSASVALAIVGISLDPAINITGKIGDTYEVDYTTNLTAPVTWTPLISTLKLTTSPQTVVDTSGLGSRRFYRAVFLH